MSFEYWFMFPVAILVATTAMASGVEGATFFTPIFLLALGMPVEVAVGTGLITEVFGFASGVFAYARRRLIDYRLGMNLLVATVPMALLGTWLAGIINGDYLKIVLGMGLVAVAVSFLRTPGRENQERMDASIEKDYGGEKGETCLVSAADEKLCYTVCNKNEGRFLSGIGGLFVGMIATGLGEMNAYFLLQRCRVPSKVSVATSVFVVAITALMAAGGHVYRFVQTGGSVVTTVLNIVVFTVPGVIVGGQLGSFVANAVPQRILERAMGVLFILVAGLTLGDAFF